MSSNTLNLVITGVGGQGQITLARVIAEAALIRGINAIVAETHGLSQRGGTVIVHVRLGEVEAPLIPPGTADAILAMELIEAARYAYYLRKGSIAVINDYLVPPPLPKIEVPSRDELLDTIRSYSDRIVLVPATHEALRVGDSRVANMILFGAAIKSNVFKDFIDFSSAEEAIKRVLGRAAKPNIEALHRGADLAK
jgi:indolepyruvate ferredoxin oxidoreductase beta subunit